MNWDRQRKKRIKDGKHPLDKVSKYNLDEYKMMHNCITETRLELQDMKCEWIDIIACCICGPKNSKDDRCQYCKKNIGIIFFKKHPNPKRSCYSCKCNHISMLTRKQALAKYPQLKLLNPELFDMLDDQNKSVFYKHRRHYKGNVYYMFEDIESIHNQFFGSSASTKNTGKRKQTFKNKTQPPKKKRRKK